MAKITGCVISFFKSIFHIDTMPKMTAYTFNDDKLYCIDTKGSMYLLTKDVTLAQNLQ